MPTTPVEQPQHPTNMMVHQHHKHLRRRRQQCGYSLSTLVHHQNLLIVLLVASCCVSTFAQRQETYLLPGHNMENLRISELRQVGSVVHQLKALDRLNEGRNFTYHLTGDTFKVDEITGEVTLMKPLDRERQAQFGTVINVVDSRTEEILESRRRQIVVEDVDDSWPVFSSSRSSVSGLNQGLFALQVEVSEQAPLGSIVIGDIQVTDADEGPNAEIVVECRAKQSSNQACDVFTVESRRLNQGRYSLTIRTKASLDYERVQSYKLAVVARGKRPSELKGIPLETEAIININVANVQDESPVFVNAPYSLSMPEGLKRGTRLLTLIVQDGDLAPQRDLSIIVVPGPFSDYFQLTNDLESSKLWYLETNTTIDREQMTSEMFTISLLAVELDEASRPIPSEVEIYQAMREPAHSKGTMRKEDVTIMVLDVADSLPVFVRASSGGQLVESNLLTLNVSESLMSGASVPNLDLAVQDMDQGINSRFKLTLTDADIGPKASEAFALESELIYGKSEIVLNVVNSSLIDYENEALRTYKFSLVASKTGDSGEILVQMLELQLNIVDANDNAPEFDRDQFVVEVPEGSAANREVATIRARDRDSGLFGQVEYMLRGPGASKFKVDSRGGRILVGDCGHSCLDYEAQSSFSLTYEARDGGGQTRNVSVIINVADVNDHAPKFTESVYKRELISDNLSSKQNYISPQLIVRARDGDGPSQGRNNITYRIVSSNLTGLEVEPTSGLVYMSQPLELDQLIANLEGQGAVSPAPSAPSSNNAKRPMDRKIVFAAEVVADDNGSPAQNSTATILLVVKGNQDGAPQFRQDTYLAYVRENQPPGKAFFQVQAVDPDDKDSQLRYSLGYDLNDLVSIDALTGELSFKSQVDFDDFNGAPYNVTVYATDNGRPYPLRASAMVSILVQDVNNKSPSFERPEFGATLVQGKTKPRDVILQVKASDLDRNAQLNYSLIDERLYIRDRTGQVFTLDDVANATSGYLSHMNKADRLKLVADLRRLFGINKQTGQVVLRAEPDYSFLASVTVTVRVVDLNQEVYAPTGQLQESFVECRFELQSQVDRAPVFAPPWSLDNRNYDLSILEELPVGTQVFSLLAKDPTTSNKVDMYEKVFESDPRDYFRVDRSSGIVTINRRIDYEELQQQQQTSRTGGLMLRLSVRALGPSDMSSVANLNVQLVDVNDNPPVFRNATYYASVSESLAPGQDILTVTADDRDSNEFGQVFYSLAPGHLSDLFAIHSRKGVISLKKGAKLDRDTEPSHLLVVSASDCNETLAKSTSDQAHLSALEQPVSGCKRTSCSVEILVTDENDNDPVFVNVNRRGELEAITSETVSVGTVIAQALATDLDEGLNGQVSYEIVKNDEQVSRLFQIDSDGFISASSSLSGLGRATPYRLTIRAFDQGKSVSRQSYASLLLTISDVVANDGVPRFLRPRPDEVVTLSESVGPSTFVYRVQAIDPDEDSNGKLLYKFLQPSDTFEIDPFDGVIKTQYRLQYPLDREQVPNYTLIIVAQDLGTPPKQAHQVLTIQISDINDNEPYFERQLDDPPVVLYVDEELPKDSLVGVIQAIDKDSAQNALISYEITEGNHNNLFRLNWEPEVNATTAGDGQQQVALGNNPCRIYSTGRLDRETRESYTLTVRASSKSRNQFIHSRDALGSRNNPLNQYNASDFSKLRVTIKLVDINDNRPVFVQQHPKSVVDSSTDIYTQLMELQAVDLDSSSADIQYSIVEALYYSDSRLSRWPEEAARSSRYDYSPSLDGSATGNPLSMRHVFDIDSRTGILRNSISLRPYIDGYFEVYVKADSGQPTDLSGELPKCHEPNSTASSNHLPPGGADIIENCFVAITKAVVFVTRQRETFRFVFDKTKLNDRFDEFKEKIQQALEDIMFEPSTSGQVQASLGDPRASETPASRAEKVYLNTFQTDFYEREDGSLDFSTITSCSQLLKFDDRSRQDRSSESFVVPNQVVNYDDVLGLMKTLNSTLNQQRQHQQKSPPVSSLFSQYGLVKIERCMPDKTMYKMTLPERLALYFASFIALMSILLAFIVSRMRKSYEKNLKLLQRSKYQYMGPYA